MLFTQVVYHNVLSISKHAEIQVDPLENVCNGVIEGKQFMCANTWPLEFYFNFDFANFLGFYNTCCHFPFTYENVIYNQCTTAGEDYLWCSTKVDAKGTHISHNWAKCDKTCMKGKYLPNTLLILLPGIVHSLLKQ